MNSSTALDRPEHRATAADKLRAASHFLAEVDSATAIRLSLCFLFGGGDVRRAVPSE